METNTANEPSGDQEVKSNEIPDHPKSPEKEENGVMNMKHHMNFIRIKNVFKSYTQSRSISSRYKKLLVMK